MKDKKTEIKPVAGYVLIEPQKQEKTTASGIILPESRQNNPQQGKVLAVGGSTFIISHNGDHEIKAPCEINDNVIYREWGGKEYKKDDVELLILKFEDIMAIIK